MRLQVLRYVLVRQSTAFVTYVSEPFQVSLVSVIRRPQVGVNKYIRAVLAVLPLSVP